MKRIFIGIPINGNLQKVILNWRNQNQGDFNQNRGIRWLSGKNLHITLAPPWYEEDTNEIISRLNDVKINPFEIKFEQITFGPNPKSPRLIWASGKTPQALVDLKKEIEQILPENAKTEIDRPFRLHVTLARFKAEDFNSFKEKNLNQKVNWNHEADGFILYESRLSSRGADYVVLADF